MLESEADNDDNKDLSDIFYNHLNLPALIVKPNPTTGVNTIRYTYDAAGNKLNKLVEDVASGEIVTTETMYVSGFVYENKNDNLPYSFQYLILIQ